MGFFDQDSIANPFRIVNLVIGALMVLGGLSSFFPLSFRTVVLAIYTILFGALVILAEFSMPNQVARYASFLMSFIGRGLFYIFMGALVLAPGALRIVGGSVIMLVGAIYIVLEFTPSIEPPSNMRGDEPGYEAPVGETV
ncbi:Golgi apparatus membrane protein TVP15 [Lipomyces tetrasporus]|uniref:Golgi apparatus membrane protein TVP15 n=2 Tax=Lipomyces TaxID=29828 RepID=A0AAD7VS73_9ASCO|nr:Golgi apparatus membrane protein TVP15 [Lipomyces tetrasporus]KAJ8099701.1 Golgi apparatus membrane protein TVP15 [Lipomyces tetrasporus]